MITRIFVYFILWAFVVGGIVLFATLVKRSKEQESKDKKEKVMVIKVGDKIEIIEMKDEPTYKGKRGTVKYIDDYGMLHGTWGSLAIDLNVDTIKVIKDEQ